ncbi:MAG: CotH kinase family protein [Acidimicrobiia bacterium]
MTRTRSTAISLRRVLAPGLATITVALLAGCSGDDQSASATVASSATAAATEDSQTSESSAVGDTATADQSDLDLGAVGSLDSAEVHEISIAVEPADYEAMLEDYSSTGNKEWIEATVTIDGATYERVGLRLKGNSSLRRIAGSDGREPATSSTTDDPASLPWLIRLDKYVDDQSHDGLTELVVRSNSSATALNEAVALELLELAGLAAQDAVAASFSVNGSDPVLRLVIEHPDDVWMAEVFDATGALYKAESTGDYGYRGDDPDSYAEVFDQEAGADNTDLTPLIEFLDFINNADDVTFEAELGDRLDVDAFATYLAMQELLDNFDDIDGPGNNSYLHYDTDAGRFTVVPWDYNLAFGAGPGGGTAPGRIPGGERPANEVGGPRVLAGRSNVLVERFLAVDAWQALYDERIDELRAELYESGIADNVLTSWTAIITSSGLVDDATIAAESDQIAQQLD